VALRRTGLDLAVERDIVDAAGRATRVRLSARFEIDPDGAPPSTEEIRAQFRALAEELDQSLPPGAVAPAAARADRPLQELIETYRPRQVELLDLLREEGELTEGEFTRLRQYLADRSSAPVVEPGVTERPIAAAPLALDRTPTVSRPVPELLTLYRIESLKQAGAVRGRRQISYEEYMALKRHFERPAPAEPPTPDVRS
jgi:hypothetical protein